MKNNHQIKVAAIFFVIASSFFTPNIQAQHTEIKYSDLQLKENQYYSKKHKNQKRTAWILMTSGSVLTLGGMVGQAATATMDLFTILIVQEAPEKINLTGTYVAYAGLATMATSIPFFIASGKNKKRANFSLQQQKITMGHKINQQANYNSIALRITLGK
jgi:hypothetical protein